MTSTLIDTPAALDINKVILVNNGSMAKHV